jgi:hypothetical protein
VTETKGIDRYLLLKAPSTWRLLLTRLHRDAGGNPEWFVFACAVKSALHDEGHPDSVRTHHQSRRAEPFLRGWQGAMSHWASYNCDGLKKSLSCHSREPDRAPGRRPISDRVLVAPASPVRPALSLPVLRRLGLSPDLRWSPLSYHVGSTTSAPR